MLDHGEAIHSTFSQREGAAPLPEPMQLEHLSVDFRNTIWYYIDQAIKAEMNHHYYKHDSVLRQIIFHYTLEILHQPHDALDHSPSEHQTMLRELILTSPYDKVLTLLEHILRQIECPKQLREELEDVFHTEQVAYCVRYIEDVPTVIPRFNEESGALTEQAIERIERNGPAGSKRHFREATQLINEKRYGDAVRECVHAVESTARVIAPEGNTLGLALKSLEEAGVQIHPALRQGFEKIYGYSCDEDGIRHALLDKYEANVDLSDAVFMFGACASFTAYLIDKHSHVT